jgi:selenocysteine lyase/cysteine desulfurase
MRRPATRHDHQVRVALNARIRLGSGDDAFAYALAKVNATVYGITARGDISHRTPTLCFNLPGISPARVTEELAKRNIGVRDGHMYSPRLMKRLGLTKESGAVRASLVHYNTLEEVRRFESALATIAGG